MGSNNMCYFFVNDFFYLAKCLQGSSMSYHVSVRHFFLFSNNILLYGYVPFYSSVHRFMGIWVVSFYGCINSTGSYSNSMLDILRSGQTTVQNAVPLTPIFDILMVIINPQVRVNRDFPRHEVL